MRHLIDPLDFSQEEITSLLDLADRICADPAAYQDVAAHKKLATLFYEPSTRTRLSFEAAMLNLGGHVLGFPSETVSSASKGESVADTIRVVSCYADIVAMRHPKEGAPLRASRYSRIPVINAGDGGHQHPTQTLTDLMTIRRRMGRLDDLTIGLCGDLKFGRTVHSLLKTMARCKNVRFVLISPEELRVPDYIINDVLEANGIPYKETRSLEESMPELDILYMTRVQKERFFNEEDYIRLKNSYILTKEKMGLAKPDMAVLDVMLPDMDGFMLAKTIREQNPIPILFLTAKGEIDDKSKGFEAGADEDTHFRATSLETLRNMVAAGSGITLLPALAVPRERKRDGVVYLPCIKPEPRRTIGLVYRPGSPLRSRYEQLAEAIRGSMDGHFDSALKQAV